jgi:hypothetical protein
LYGFAVILGDNAGLWPDGTPKSKLRVYLWMRILLDTYIRVVVRSSEPVEEQSGQRTQKEA